MSVPNDIEALKDLVVRLLGRVEFLEKELAAQRVKFLAKIQELEQENQELRARLDANSRNSHLPPSSEGLRKKQALPKKKKKRGGQKGHNGKTLEMVSHSDKTIACVPRQCPCGHSLEGVEGRLVERRQVFDLPEPRLEVIEYQRWGSTCPKCHEPVSGVFPADVPAPVQYGAGVKALSTLLNVRGCLSYEKIKQLFSDLFGYAINESTLHSANEKGFERLQASEQAIFRSLLRGTIGDG